MVLRVIEILHMLPVFLLIVLIIGSTIALVVVFQRHRTNTERKSDLANRFRTCNFCSKRNSLAHKTCASCGEPNWYDIRTR
jgi:hypothetical protein